MGLDDWDLTEPKVTHKVNMVFQIDENTFAVDLSSSKVITASKPETKKAR